jgi:hypothetical protein
MPALHRRRAFIMLFILVITGVFVYISYDRTEPADNNEQAVDLAIVDELLRSMEQASPYRLIPESIMTGLCWTTGNGSREGIFKDVNAGVAQWRERQPDAENQQSSGLSAPASEHAYSSLSSELADLSFEATDYTVKESKAEIKGILKVADREQEIVLDIDLPVASMDSQQQAPVAIKAVTEVDLADLQDKQPGSKTGPVNLCLMMQVARYADLQPSSSERPMQLSQFYLD